MKFRRTPAMIDSVNAKVPKAPFLLADVLLCAVAGVILYRNLPAEGVGGIILCAASLAAGAFGAWLAVWPYVLEHHVSLKVIEIQSLGSVVAQIQKMESVGEKITKATEYWQTAQDEGAKVVKAASEIEKKMAAETQEFLKFLQKANDQEKSQLKLEVDKLRRSEGEWLQVSVRTLDHIFALTQAASRSGQAGLINQLQQFQMACRDISRRMGLVPFTADAGEPFDPERHQMPDSDESPAPGTLIQDTLATGYTYQGQLIRRAVVAFTAPSVIKSADNP